MAYQKDISAVLGLSVSTVSKALKGYPDISEETRRKVLSTAEELDYNYNREAGRRPGPRRYGAVGILAPGSADLVKSPYYKELICGMTGEAAENHRDLVIMGEDSAEQDMSWIGRVTARRIDGICLLTSREDLYEGRFADLLKSGIPLIGIENEVAGHTSICRDFRHNAALILEHLRNKGHRMTAFQGDQGIEYRKRASMLREEAGKLNMGCLEVDLGELPVAKMLDLLAHRGVTCIIFTSYKEAEEWIAKWKKSGLEIPESISAAVLQTGCEEWPGADERITCVSNAPEELGREAVRRLVHFLEHPETDAGEMILVSGKITRGITVKDMSGNSARKI